MNTTSHGYMAITNNLPSVSPCIFSDHGFQAVCPRSLLVSSPGETQYYLDSMSVKTADSNSPVLKTLWLQEFVPIEPSAFHNQWLWETCSSWVPSVLLYPVPLSLVKFSCPVKHQPSISPLSHVPILFLVSATSSVFRCVV